METVRVNLGLLTGKVFIGRSNGKKAREFFNLDKIKPETHSIEVVVPENTISVNSSFFLGLFGPDITKINDYDKFFEYVDITHVKPRLKTQLLTAVKRSLSNQDYGL